MALQEQGRDIPPESLRKAGFDENGIQILLKLRDNYPHIEFTDSNQQWNRLKLLKIEKDKGKIEEGLVSSAPISPPTETSVSTPYEAMENSHIHELLERIKTPYKKISAALTRQEEYGNNQPFEISRRLYGFEDMQRTSFSWNELGGVNVSYEGLVEDYKMDPKGELYYEKSLFKLTKDGEFSGGIQRSDTRTREIILDISIHFSSASVPSPETELAVARLEEITHVLK